jgi:type III restriction enzyme
MSDFSLMDTMECGIVKLPRVPVADNVPGGDTPKFRNLWDEIKRSPHGLPKKGRSASSKGYDPLALPMVLLSALEALCGHYRKTFELWEQEGIGVPPVFIVVCNNTSTSELIYQYISGFHRQNDDGTTAPEYGRLELFRNHDGYGNWLARPNTILIDSAQLESGEALDKDFREMAGDEIERFHRDMVERTGDIRAGETIDDATLLREVMNTVGKKGKLGEQIRCVVSVSMLTEAGMPTHILGVRAFGTQLLCEQVVGRALRRQSYDLNDEGLFNVEYADVLGIPFDFAAKPVVSPPAKPRETVRVHAVKPDRDALEIIFPRVEGYRVELPEERLEARFGPDSILNLTPQLVGPSVTKNQGNIGEGVDLTLAHLEDMRSSTILFYLARHLLYNKYRDPGEAPKLHLFGQLKRITRQWLEGGYLKCSGGTYPALLVYKEIADMAAERVKAAITLSLVGDNPVKAILDAYNPTGSTAYVNFTTSKETRWQTDPRKCHVNWLVCESDCEAEFCRVAQARPRVRAYVKNQNLGLEVPYLMGSTPRKYIPDFIVQVDDGIRAYWAPGVNNLGKFGRWAFAEFTAVNEIEAEFNKLIEGLCVSGATSVAA